MAATSGRRRWRSRGSRSPVFHHCFPGRESVMPGRIVRGPVYLKLCFFAGAVLDVYDQNARREAEGAKVKANADDWFLDQRLRKDVKKRARTFWCRRTGKPESFFPYSTN